jgi:hypothetical protein
VRDTSSDPAAARSAAGTLVVAVLALAALLAAALLGGCAEMDYRDAGGFINPTPADIPAYTGPERRVLVMPLTISETARETYPLYTKKITSKGAGFELYRKIETIISERVPRFKLYSVPAGDLKGAMDYWMLGEMGMVKEAMRLRPQIEQAEYFFVGVVSDFRERKLTRGLRSYSAYDVYVQAKFINGSTLVNEAIAEGHGASTDIREATLGATIDAVAKIVKRLNARSGR